MRILQGIQSLTEDDRRRLTVGLPGGGGVGLSPRSATLTIGNFDGMHLGHQALMRRVKARAAKAGAVSVVMTFDPHPLQVLAPQKHLKRIFDLDDQIECLRQFGLDALVIEPFSREFSQLPPRRFLSEWLIEPFRPSSIVVGYDFSFGAGREGSIAFLEQEAAGAGYELEVVPPVRVGEMIVSSSQIRIAIGAGDVALAARLLGRPFYIKGLVERGAGRGRSIGLPTANVQTAAETLPAQGVYAAWAEIHGQRWKAAVNIGVNPTFTEGQAPVLSIEAHILDLPFDSDLYGEKIRLEFIERLREERKFSGLEAFLTQIRTDVQKCRELLQPGPAGPVV